MEQIIAPCFSIPNWIYWQTANNTDMITIVSPWNPWWRNAARYVQTQLPKKHKHLLELLNTKQVCQWQWRIMQNKTKGNSFTVAIYKYPLANTNSGIWKVNINRFNEYPHFAQLLPYKWNYASTAIEARING